MKHLPVVLIITAVLAGCSKDDEVKTIEPFNLEEYAITGKFFGSQESYVILFNSKDEAKICSVRGGLEEISFELKGDTIFIESYDTFRVFSGFFVLKDGVLDGVLSVPIFQSSSLLKIPEVNVLAGKTYTGPYLRQDNTILHNNFFYTFRPNELEYDAGYQVGYVVRTESYELIGNIAALRSLINGDREFLVYSGDKLEINYLTSTLEQFHGTLNLFP